jgi:hypothetical protein
VLYIVLALVLAAFGLLIAALTTANTIWAWVSVTISVVAAALLIADWVGARRRQDAAASNSTTKKSTTTSNAPAAAATSRAPAAPPPPREIPRELPREVPREPEPEPLVEQTVQQPPVLPPPPDQEPAEEPTDAADLLIVSELDVEVRVVDEHPRYHLINCAWLQDKPTLPLPLSEARQLGFTPCAYCGPDAVLAARHRAAR